MSALHQQTTDDRLRVRHLRRFRLPKPAHDPFAGDTNEPCAWEWIKLVVIGIILLPLRALLFALLLGLLNLYLTVCAWGYDIKYDGEDHVPPELLARTKPVVQICCRILLFIMGCYHIPVKGKPADPHEVPVVVMNHISYFEPFFGFAQGFVTIGKKDAAQFLPFCKPSTYLQIIQVEREDKSSTSRSRKKIERWLNRRREDGFVPFACFPEGTTTSGRSLVRFKTGAFAPGHPVQPLVFKTKYSFLNPSHTFGAKHWYFRLFSQLVNFLEAEYLPPYYPSEEEKQHPKLFALNIREYMCAHSNLHLSEFSTHDVMLQYSASKIGANPAKFGVEWGVFDVNFKLQLAEAKALLKFFVPLADKEVGIWSRKTFSSAIPPGLQEAAPSLYEFFDQDDDGVLSFRDFLWAACLLRHECDVSFEQLMGEDDISESEFNAIKELVTENVAHQRYLGRKKHA